MIWEQPESKEELLRRARSYKRPMSGPVELGLNIAGVIVFLIFIARLIYVLATMP